jgi:hypothetical protein
VRAPPDNQAAFDAKIESLARVINQAAPDVLALQEIGPGGVLDPLQAKLDPAMPHRAVGQPDSRGIRVAILSRLPLLNIADVSPFPAGVRAVQFKDEIFDDPATAEDEAATHEMGRSALEVSVEVDGTPVTVVTAHFKSKLISYARLQGLVGGSQFSPNDEGERLRYAGYALFRRAGEAMTVRDRLDTVLADPNDPTVSAGSEPSCSAVTSTTNPTPPPPRSSTARPVPRSTRPPAPVFNGPTRTTGTACSTSPPSSPNRTATAGSSKVARN